MSEDIDPELDALAYAERLQRRREADAYEWRLQETLARADAAAGPLTPTERIELGLRQVHRGVVEGRARLEELERARDVQHADLVNGEARLRVLSSEARQARVPRHRQAHEITGPRRPRADNRLPASTRTTIVVVSEIDPRTQRSLQDMGLVAIPRKDGKEEAPATTPARASLLDRILPWRAEPVRAEPVPGARRSRYPFGILERAR